jgi:hypothetical protein
MTSLVISFSKDWRTFVSWSAPSYTHLDEALKSQLIGIFPMMNQ